MKYCCTNHLTHLQFRPQSVSYATGVFCDMTWCTIIKHFVHYCVSQVDHSLGAYQDQIQPVVYVNFNKVILDLSNAHNSKQFGTITKN